jgi:hydroxyethylthiazole kinase-like uncharacterized protein yjeF
MYLVTAAEMQEMDRKTIETFGISGLVLMENAARGATRILLDQFQGLENKKIGVIAGRGNNGGDGFVMARYLAQKGPTVTVYLLAEKSMVKGDAAVNLNFLEPMGIDVIEMPDPQSFAEHRIGLRHQDVWVDAILGTGLKSNVKGYFKDVIDFMNHSKKPIFAIDIPSGLNSDTGQPCGTCVQAHTTVTFAFPKIGHFLFPGADYTGRLEIIDIGIPRHVAEQVGPSQRLLTPKMMYDAFEPRSAEAHKGHTGHLLVVAGSTGKTGAAAMTALAAMRCGAGLVTLGIPESLNMVLEVQVIEAMTCPLPETKGGLLGESAFKAVCQLLADKKCLALGPGLGTAIETQKLVHGLVQHSPIPIVIDADGLNCLVGHTHILKNLKVPAILTPHPGEMARLMHSTTAEIQKDRVDCARSFAKNFQVHVVLKGARTVIAHPDGRVFVNPTGNSGMASGGMGDVLTGMIAGFVSQGYSPETSAHLGVYLHGSAGDDLCAKKGPFGYLATELMHAVPEQIQKLSSGSFPLEIREPQL